MGSAPLRYAATFLLAACALHLVIAWWTGTTDVVLAAAAFVGGAILLTGWRGPAWIIMLVMIVATGAELARIGTGIAPDNLIYAVVGVDVLAVIALFLGVWQNKPARRRVPG